MIQVTLRSIQKGLACPRAHCLAKPGEECQAPMSGAEMVLGAHDERRKAALERRDAMRAAAGEAGR